MKDDRFIHPSAIVETDDIAIGGGIKIWQNTVIQKDVQIGRDCKIGANVFIEANVSIGNNVTIKNNVAIYTGVNIEDDVFLGPSCVFTNVINPRSFISRKSEFRETTVKKGATIGANATVICGNIVGSYAMVGAGSVLTHDVPDYALVVGNPARLAGYVCRCGNKLTNRFTHRGCAGYCEKCGKEYPVHL